MIPISAEPADVIRTNPPGVHRTCHLTVACSPRKRSKRRHAGSLTFLAGVPAGRADAYVVRSRFLAFQGGTWRPVTDGCVRSGMYA
jgi:hypothetical protein